MAENLTTVNFDLYIYDDNYIYDGSVGSSRAVSPRRLSYSVLLSLMIARVQQALLRTAWVPRHGINASLCIVRLKSRQAPKLSDEAQHPSSTDRGDASRKNCLVYSEISMFG